MEKTTNNGTEYIVIKHPLKIRGNVFILGAKFCDGIAVIKKGSKLHFQIKKSPLLRNRKELGLEWLQKYFKSKEIKLIYGSDIYAAFMCKMNEINAAKENTPPTELPEKVIDALEDEQAIIEATIQKHKKENLCTTIKASGEVCKKRISNNSKTRLYCYIHLNKEESITEAK